MTENWLWLTGGAILGWLVSRFGDVLRDVGRRWLMRRAVLSELVELDDRASQVWMSLARSLQLHSLGTIDGFATLPITHRVFEAHYSDAMLVFSRVQRAAIEMIHSYVDQLNIILDELRQIARSASDRVADGESASALGKRFGDKLEAGLVTAAQLQWMVRYYRTRPDFPVLEKDGEYAQKYRDYLVEIRGEIAAIEESAKGLTLADFGEARSPLPAPQGLVVPKAKSLNR